MELSLRRFEPAPQHLQNLKVWASVAVVHGVLLLSLSQWVQPSQGPKHPMPPASTPYVLLESWSQVTQATPALASPKQSAPGLPSLPAAQSSSRSAIASPPVGNADPSKALGEQDGALAAATITLPAGVASNANVMPASSPVDVAPGLHVTVDAPSSAIDLGRSAVKDSAVARSAAAHLPQDALKSLKPIHAPTPTYPALSKQLGENGTVWVSLVVDGRGVPSQVQIKASSGYGRLDQAALVGVRNWRFPPSDAPNVALLQVVELPVVFKFSGP